MALAFPRREVPRGPNGEDLAAGAFPVPKSTTVDRSILDRRRKNWAERRWPPPLLPHAVTFCRYILQDGKQLRVHVLRGQGTLWLVVSFA